MSKVARIRSSLFGFGGVYKSVLGMENIVRYNINSLRGGNIVKNGLNVKAGHVESL